MEQLLKWNFKLVQSIFSNKIVFGICALALTIEAILQLQLPLNTLSYFFLILGTTIFCFGYTFRRKMLRKEQLGDTQQNYYENLPGWNVSIIILALFISACYFGQEYMRAFSKMQSGEWFLLLVFPLVAFLFGIQKNAWMKSLVTGFSWAGMVTVYPVLLYGLQNELKYNPDWILGVLFLKNLAFMTALSYLVQSKELVLRRFSNA
jgi:hypothetical protein